MPLDLLATPRLVVTRLADKLIEIKNRELQQLYGDGKRKGKLAKPQRELSESLDTMKTQGFSVKDI